MDMARWSCLYRIADYVFVVEGVDAALRDLAEELYSAVRATGGCPSSRFTLERLKGRLQLLQDGVEICRSSCLSAFFQEVEAVLTGAALTGLGHFYQVHAAVAVQEGGARLLIGPPGAGKTSLVLSLAARGAAIFTDEVALIEPGLEVVAFRRDLIVHQESQALFPTLMEIAGSPPFKDFGEYRYVSPLGAGPREVQEPAPVAQLAFPVLRPGAPVALRPLGQAEAARRILEQTFNLAQWGVRGTELIGRLVETCPAVEIAFGDAREAAARLMDSEVQQGRVDRTKRLRSFR